MILTEVTLDPGVAGIFLIVGIVLVIASLVLFICKKIGWGIIFLLVGVFCILFATNNGFMPRWE